MMIAGRVMTEQSYFNNIGAYPATYFDADQDGNLDDSSGGGVIDYVTGVTISISEDDENASSFPNLQYVPNSYNGDKGSFRGTDPVFISFAIRNEGARPVATGDNISAKVPLSKNLQVDNSDFLIREFNLGGNGIWVCLLGKPSILIGSNNYQIILRVIITYLLKLLMYPRWVPLWNLRIIHPYFL